MKKLRPGAKLASVIVAAAAFVAASPSPAAAGDLPFPSLPTEDSQQSDAVVYRNSHTPGDRLADDVSMTDVDDSFCFLTGLQGRQRGVSWGAVHRLDTEWIDAFPGIGPLEGLLSGGPRPTSLPYREDGDTWKLSSGSYPLYAAAPGEADLGYADQNQVGERVGRVSAGAVCAPRSRFVTDSGGVKQVSETARVSPSNRGNTCSGDQVDHASAEMGEGRAFGHLNLVYGDLGSFSDTIEVTAAAPDEHRHLSARNTQECNGSLYGATSVFVGVPGQSTYYIQAGRDKATLRANTNGSETVRMAKTSDGVCAIRGLAGRWESVNEAAYLYPRVDSDGVEYWWATVHAGNEGEVEATFECLAYNQRSNNQGSPDDFEPIPPPEFDPSISRQIGTPRGPGPRLPVPELPRPAPCHPFDC